MKEVRKYLHNREIALNALLDKPRSKYTAGTFHLLRVELKKLSALFELLDKCSINFNRKKIIKPFKLIFKQAGRVRELQLEEALLKRHQIDNALSNHLARLRKRRLEETNVYFQIVSEELRHRLKKHFQKISQSISGLKNKKVLKFLDQKTQTIHKLIRKETLEPEQLHELRIELKMLNYNRKSLGIEQAPNPKFEVLPVLLGKWHDLEVMSAHLQKTMTTEGINREELVELQRIVAIMAANSQILLEKIIKAIPASEFLQKSLRIS